MTGLLAGLALLISAEARAQNVGRKGSVAGASVGCDFVSIADAVADAEILGAGDLTIYACP